MKTQELLRVEFRYWDTPRFENDHAERSRTITIGVFDTLEEAVREGNEVIAKLMGKGFTPSTHGKVGFSLHGYFGTPERLVMVRGKGVDAYAEIRELRFADLLETADEVSRATAKVMEQRGR